MATSGAAGLSWRVRRGGVDSARGVDDVALLVTQLEGRTNAEGTPLWFRRIWPGRSYGGADEEDGHERDCECEEQTPGAALGGVYQLRFHDMKSD
jgi:hypothetical protein